jgi:hypothetical protein
MNKMQYISTTKILKTLSVCVCMCVCVCVYIKLLTIKFFQIYDYLIIKWNCKNVLIQNSIKTYVDRYDFNNITNL